MEKSSDRRWFLKSVAAVGVAVPAGALGADPQSHHGHGEHVAQAGSVKGQSQPQVYGWLTQPEQAFVKRIYVKTGIALLVFASRAQ